MTKIIDGKSFAKELDEQLINRVISLKSKGKLPVLGILRIGNNKDDLSYERSILKKTEKLGIKVVNYVLKENVLEEEVIKLLKLINKDDGIDGLLMLRPLPSHLDDDKVRNTLCIEKDLDAITDKALSNIFMGKANSVYPCTAEAAIRLLKYYDISVSGKKVLVIGRSMVVGKPLAMLLLNENATVIVAHSKTPKSTIIEMCQSADIVIVAAGKKNLFTGEMAHKDQVVIDVGINVIDGGVYGDVFFEEVRDKVFAITPVPGGVGSVTTTILMEHLINLKEKV